MGSGNVRAVRRPLRWLIALCLLPAPAAAEWVRVESPHFVVFGEIGEKRTREYAEEFERFREALGRIVPAAAARPAAPTLVFVFKDARSFAPYRPLYQGKAVDVSGYFSGGPSLDVIMLPATNRERALRTIYHEFSHLVTANAAGSMPIWLSEGLAEYYSTFEVRPGGRSALLGGLIPGHLVHLSQERLIPLEELLAVEAESPLYNEGNRRSTLYAQSWALIHMLLNGEQDRTASFNAYVKLTSGGRASADAWREVFGDQNILEELRRYIRLAQLKAFVFEFDQALTPTTFTVSTPSAADVHAALGDLRLHVTPDAAEAHMAAAPGASPYGTAVRGLMQLDRGSHEQALPLLLEAARTPGDWLVQYRAAVGLERIATAGQEDLHRTAARAADEAFARVLARRPDLPHAIALRAMVLGPTDDGLALIQRARALAPGRPHYTIWQGQYHSTRGEFTAARALLAPLMSSLYPSAIREYARSVMGQAARLELSRTAPPAAGGDPADSRPRPRTGGIVMPVFRERTGDEQRVEGVFERIECGRTGVTLHVRVAGRESRYTAASLADVEFLTYRDDLEGKVGCGPRSPADVVYITFRPAASDAGADGIAVAVEFLPR